MHKYYLLILFCFLLLTACDKELYLDIPAQESKIVVEGSIELDRYPIVFLTRSFPFFSTIDTLAFFENIVSRAKVTVSTSHTLEILTLRKDINRYPPFYYEGTSLKGMAGETYTLTIEIENKIITAKTTIPSPVKINKLAYIPIAENDSLGYINIEITDNPLEKNYYRTFYKGTNTTYFKPTYIHAYDDSYFKQSTESIWLQKQYTNTTTLEEKEKFFQKGDTVFIKISTLDQTHFKFWQSLQNKALNINSLSPSTTSIESNIQGGLGVWGGYGSFTATLILK